LRLDSEAERRTRWPSEISWSDSDGDKDPDGNHDSDDDDSDDDDSDDDDSDNDESKQASVDRRMSDVDGWSSSEVSAS